MNEYKKVALSQLFGLVADWQIDHGPNFPEINKEITKLLNTVGKELDA